MENLDNGLDKARDIQVNGKFVINLKKFDESLPIIETDGKVSINISRFLISLKHANRMDSIEADFVEMMEIMLMSAENDVYYDEFKTIMGRASFLYDMIFSWKEADEDGFAAMNLDILGDRTHVIFKIDDKIIYTSDEDELSKKKFILFMKMIIRVVGGRYAELQVMNYCKENDKVYVKPHRRSGVEIDSYCRAKSKK